MAGSYGRHDGADSNAMGVPSAPRARHRRRQLVERAGRSISREANRSPDHKYRTAPLNGLWTHQKGGFYHDGRFATLRDVVDHYVAVIPLTLSEDERDDIVEYLKSLPRAEDDGKDHAEG